MQPNRINGRTLEQRVRMCEAKQRWADQRSAEAGALCSLERNGNTEKLYTYKCPICCGWHLTRSRWGRNRLRGE